MNWGLSARLSHEQKEKYLGAPVLASLGDASSRKPGELLAFAKNTAILVVIKTS